MRNVTIRQLQIFVEVADTLSLARVAERLRLTPSAVSFQIGKIESQTGFALLERIGRRVALTEAGAVLLGYARLMLQSLKDADQALGALNGIGGGRVKLGLVSTAKYIVPHIIARFRIAYPGVSVQLIEGNRRLVLEMLASGQIDLVIMGQPPDGADVAASRFASHPSVFIAAPGHRLRAAPALEAGMLAGEEFVMREEGSGTRMLADQVFRSAGFAPRVTLETTSNEMIKQAVIAGMGIALLSRHTIGLELALGLIAALPVSDVQMMRAWFVVRRRSLPLLPVHARLHDFLVTDGQQIIDEIGRGHAALAGGAPPPVAPGPARRIAIGELPRNAGTRKRI